MDADALQGLLSGHGAAGIVFLGVAADHVHGEARPLQGLGGIKGELGGADILRVKKLAEKHNVFFLTHTKTASLLKIQISDRKTLSGKETS